MTAFSAEHGYWINNHFCGEIDPFLLGDACVLEVENDEEHFVVVLDMDFVLNELVEEDELGDTGILIETNGLVKLSKKEFAEIEGFVPKGIKAYKVEDRFVTFRDLRD